MIPEGMRDVLPPESSRLRAVEDSLRARFAAYGYGEVRTPWLEFAETLESADDDTLSAGYRLHDEQGHELMVRTDMTVPVARMAADRCDDEPLPLRFSYVAPCIRPWAPQRGQDGEFQQAGVELLGLDSAEADAECVALLCDALAGARPARLHGHAGLGGLPARAHRVARAARRGPREVQGGARRPRLPAGGEHRRQRRRGVRRPQGAVAHPRAQRRRRDPRPGAQARAQRRDGDGGRPPRARARSGRRCRVRRPPRVRLRAHAGPGLLHRAHRRGVRAGRRPAGRDGRTLRRAAGPVRLGHPRRGLRRRRRPRRRRARGGRSRARRLAGGRALRRRARGAGAGGAAAPRRSRRHWRCPRTPGRWSRLSCCAAAAPTRCASPMGAR